MKQSKIFIDTSVIGGCFDDEFKEFSNLLFQTFHSGTSIPVISEIILAELEEAPEDVKTKFKELKNIEIITINTEIRLLAEKYLKEKVISYKYAPDALHIAAATIAKVDVLISWNFKHIVNLEKIRKFNAVNLKEGYNILEIRTPREVIEND